MSQSGSQAAAFFREVARTRVVWFVRDDEGSPTRRRRHEQFTVTGGAAGAGGRVVRNRKIH